MSVHKLLMSQAQGVCSINKAEESKFTLLSGEVSESSAQSKRTCCFLLINLLDNSFTR